MIGLRYTFEWAAKLGGRVSLTVTPPLPRWLCVVDRITTRTRNRAYIRGVPEPYVRALRFRYPTYVRAIARAGCYAVYHGTCLPHHMLSFSLLH